MSERFFRSNRPGYPHPVSSELKNSGIRVAVGERSLTERRRWRPPYQTGKTVLAGDQWWPRTSGGRLRFAHAITHLSRRRLGLFMKENKRSTYKERLTKFSAWEANDKQFYQPTPIPTPLQFRGMTIFQTQIIRYRNKPVQIAVLIFFYHEKL